MSRSPKLRNIVGDVGWKESGNCSENPKATSDLYAVYEHDQAQAASKWCAGCPVRQACLDFAVANREEFGVWGGMTERGRRQYVKSLRRRAS
jgi:WhiB family transcriptional regulator, redox-sensing transcriptional regulator